MRKLRVEIKAISPLYLGALKPYGSFLETHKEIPGTLLRGALARKLLADCRHKEYRENHEICPIKEDCPFWQLVMNGISPFCVPTDSLSPSLPPFRTMVTCKTAPGFKSEGRDFHGVRDLLLHHLAFGEAGSPKHLPPDRCECESPLEPFNQRFLRNGKSYRTLKGVLKIHRMTHVGIDRYREAAQEGMLFSVQAITEGARFIGELTIPENWSEQRIKDFKEALEGIERIGAEQTYGFGKVEIKVNEVNVVDDIDERLEIFNAQLKAVWPKYAPGMPKSDYFPIDLLTPAILELPDGTPTTCLSEHILRDRVFELGFKDLPELKIVRSFTAPMIVSGWSEAWGLPKSTALAAVAGSVYVFKTPDIEGWLRALKALESHGIGKRRNEGFGAIRICDPIHQEVEAI